MWSFSNEILFIESMCSTMDSSWRKSSPSLDFFFLARVPPNFPRKDSSFFILVDCRLADAPRLRDMFCVREREGGVCVVTPLSAHPSPWCIQGAEDNQTAKHKVTETSQALKRQRWLNHTGSQFFHWSTRPTAPPTGLMGRTHQLCVFPKKTSSGHFELGFCGNVIEKLYLTCYRKLCNGAINKHLFNQAWRPGRPEEGS